MSGSQKASEASVNVQSNQEEDDCIVVSCNKPVAPQTETSANSSRELPVQDSVDVDLSDFIVIDDADEEVCKITEESQKAKAETSNEGKSTANEEGMLKQHRIHLHASIKAIKATRLTEYQYFIDTVPLEFRVKTPDALRNVTKGSFKSQKKRWSKALGNVSSYRVLDLDDVKDTIKTEKEKPIYKAYLEARIRNKKLKRVKTPTPENIVFDGRTNTIVGFVDPWMEELVEVININNAELNQDPYKLEGAGFALDQDFVDSQADEICDALFNDLKGKETWTAEDHAKILAKYKASNQEAYFVYLQTSGLGKRTLEPDLNSPHDKFVKEMKEMVRHVEVSRFQNPLDIDDLKKVIAKAKQMPFYLEYQAERRKSKNKIRVVRTPDPERDKQPTTKCRANSTIVPWKKEIALAMAAARDQTVKETVPTQPTDYEAVRTEWVDGIRSQVVYKYYTSIFGPKPENPAIDHRPVKSPDPTNNCHLNIFKGQINTWVHKMKQMSRCHAVHKAKEEDNYKAYKAYKHFLSPMDRPVTPDVDPNTPQNEFVNNLRRWKKEVGNAAKKVRSDARTEINKRRAERDPDYEFPGQSKMPRFEETRQSFDFGDQPATSSIYGTATGSNAYDDELRSRGRFDANAMSTSPRSGYDRYDVNNDYSQSFEFEPHRRYRSRSRSRSREYVERRPMAIPPSPPRIAGRIEDVYLRETVGHRVRSDGATTSSIPSSSYFEREPNPNSLGDGLWQQHGNPSSGFIFSREHRIDLQFITCLSGGDDVLRYIENRSKYYAMAVDQRSTDGRSLLSSVIKSGNSEERKLRPCGHFNKNDTCSQPPIHVDSNYAMCIHSCALCYYALHGLINMHSVAYCPLLQYV